MKALLTWIDEKTKGIKALLLALIVAMPDILDSLSVVDWTSILPAGYATKAASMILIARVAFGVVKNILDKSAAKAKADDSTVK